MFTTLFDLVLAPFRHVDPAISLAILSLVTGVVMLLVFKVVSNQRAIRLSKARVVSHLLAIRLFKDDPWMTVRGLGGALLANLGYLRHALFPIVVMIVPVVFLLIHLEPFYAYRPLAPGETTRVSVFLAGQAGTPLPPVSMQETTDGTYRSETPPLRIPSLREVDWRVRVDRPGVHALGFDVNGHAFTKDVVVGGGLERITAVRPGAGFLNAMLHPGEARLDTGLGVVDVRVDYPERRIDLFGVSMAWWLAFFVLTLVFAFLLKKPLRVEA